MLFPGPGMSLAVAAAVLPGWAEHFHAWAPLIPQGPLTGAAALPHFKEAEMEAQREVTGLVQDLLARKWLRARSMSRTALRSPAICWEQPSPARALASPAPSRFSPVPGSKGVGRPLQRGPGFEVTASGQSRARPARALA